MAKRPEQLFVLLVRLYPARLREGYSADALGLIRDRWRDEPGLRRRVRLCLDLVGDLVVTRARHQPGPRLVAADGNPHFQLIESAAPRPRAFAAGFVATTLVFTAIASVPQPTGQHRGRFPIRPLWGLGPKATQATVPEPRAASTPARSQPLAFEAASIKINKSGSPGGTFDISPGGRLTATNLSLQYLIRFAYERSPRNRGLEPFEVTGGPAWLTTERFDVNATAGHAATLSEMRMMLQTLLVERFKLMTRDETKRGPVYRLIQAQRGRLGPQLRKAAEACEAQPLDPLRGITPGVAEPCGYFGLSPSAPIGSDKAYQAIRGLTMDDLAIRLYPYLGRRLINDTGLSGYFDGEFEFTTEVVMPPPPPGLPNPYDGRVLPSIFSVLPQQLGLRVESGRGDVETLVVDRAEPLIED